MRSCCSSHGQDGAVPVGNESGVVGQFLMEHPEFYLAGECVLEAELDGYWPAANKSTGMHTIVADGPLSIQHGLYGCALQCMKKSSDHDMARFISAESGRPYLPLRRHRARRDAAIAIEPRGADP